MNTFIDYIQDQKNEIEQFKNQLEKLETQVNLNKQNAFLYKQLQQKLNGLELNLESKVNAICSNIIIPDIQPQKLPELQDRKRAISSDQANLSFDLEKKFYLQANRVPRYNKQQIQRQILNEYNDDILKQKIDFSFEQHTSLKRIQKPQKQVTQVLVFDAPPHKPFLKKERKHYHFMIQKGKRVASTELQIMKQKNLNEWNLINTIITRMEIINLKHQCPCFFVDGKSILQLIHGKRTITLTDLINCLLNKDEIIPSIWHRLFIGQDGLDRAAEKIQANFKGFIQLKKFKILKQLYRSAIIIQQYFKKQQFKIQAKNKINERNNFIYSEYKKRQQKFQDNWNEIKCLPRVEIHIPSLPYPEYQRLTMSMFLQRENTQLNRIFRVIDPLIDIIYVLPFNLDQEILAYYERIFELQGLLFKKVKFIVPECTNHLNSHMSLISKLLYSNKALKTIKRLINNKKSIIYPAYPSNEYIQLSHILDSPIYCGLPQHHLLYSSQCGAQMIFNKCKIPIAPGATEIYDEIEMYNTLTVLIVKNPKIKIWIFKIDFSFQGRGIATINIDQIIGLNQIIGQNEQELDENSVSTIKQLIKTQLPIKLKIAVKTLYRSYQEYITTFLTQGGSIEAFPSQDKNKTQKTSISFHISPQYEIDELCTYDSFSFQHFVHSLFIYPSITSEIENTQILNQLLEFFKLQKMFGYFTINFILWDNSFWAIGLDCYMNNQTSALFYFQCINKSYNKIYLYSPFNYHPGLTKIQLKQFFQICRLENIQFQTDQEKGQMFLFPDILQSGIISLVSVSESVTKCVQMFEEQIRVILKIAGQLNVTYGESIYESRGDLKTILDVQGALKILKRKL